MLFGSPDILSVFNRLKTESVSGIFLKSVTSFGVFLLLAEGLV